MEMCAAMNSFAFPPLLETCLACDLLWKSKARASRQRSPKELVFSVLITIKTLLVSLSEKLKELENREKQLLREYMARGKILIKPEGKG